MPRLEYITAGESHGPALVVIISGLPSGVPVDIEFVNSELSRRQGGYGRGGRQRIEHDVAEVLSGVRAGKTMGSPVAIRIANNDARLEDAEKTPPVHRPRPGHADLAGSDLDRRAEQRQRLCTVVDRPNDQGRTGLAWIERYRSYQ